MKYFTALVTLSFAVCSAQSPPTVFFTLGAPFSKASLRATLAMGDQPEVSVHEFINEASVEASSPVEMLVVKDLWLLNDFIALSRSYSNLREKRMRFSYTSNLPLDHELEWYLDNDPVLVGYSGQESTCKAMMEETLRTKLYSAMPLICNPSSLKPPPTGRQFP